MWYHPNDFEEDVSSSEHKNVGYPEGISIAPKKGIRGAETCAVCGAEVCRNSPCVTILDVANGETVKRAVHYHLPKCCISFRDRPADISVAIDNSPYSEDMKENIRDSLTGKVFGELTIDDYSNSIDEGGSDTNTTFDGAKKNEARSRTEGTS